MLNIRDSWKNIKNKQNMEDIFRFLNCVHQINREMSFKQRKSLETFPPALSDTLSKFVELYYLSPKDRIVFNPGWYPELQLEEKTSIDAFTTKKNFMFDISKNQTDDDEGRDGEYFINRVKTGGQTKQPLVFYSYGDVLYYNVSDFPLLGKKTKSRALDDQLWKSTFVGMIFYTDLFYDKSMPRELWLELTLDINEYYQSEKGVIEPLDDESVMYNNFQDLIEKEVWNSILSRMEEIKIQTTPIEMMMVLDYFHYLQILLLLSKDVLKAQSTQWRMLGTTNHFIEWFDKNRSRTRYQSIRSKRPYSMLIGSLLYFEKRIPVPDLEEIVKCLANPDPLGSKQRIKCQTLCRNIVMNIVHNDDDYLNIAYKELRKRMTMTNMYFSKMIYLSKVDLERKNKSDNTSTLRYEPIITRMNEYVSGFTFLENVMTIAEEYFTQIEFQFFANEFRKLLLPTLHLSEVMAFDFQTGEYAIKNIPLSISGTVHRYGISSYLKKQIENDGGGIYAMHLKFCQFLEFIGAATSGLLLRKRQSGKWKLTKRFHHYLTTVVVDYLKQIRYEAQREDMEDYDTIQSYIGSKNCKRKINRHTPKYGHCSLFLPNNMPEIIAIPKKKQKMRKHKHFYWTGTKYKLRRPYDRYYIPSEKKSNNVVYWNLMPLSILKKKCPNPVSTKRVVY